MKHKLWWNNTVTKTIVLKQVYKTLGVTTEIVTRHNMCLILSAKGVLRRRRKMQRTNWRYKVDIIVTLLIIATLPLQDQKELTLLF